jgi:hypothetical protein
MVAAAPVRSPRRPRWLSPLGAGAPRHSGPAPAATPVVVGVGDACPACRRGLVQVRTAGTPTDAVPRRQRFPDCRAVWRVDGTRFPGWDRPGLSARPPSTATPAGSSRSLSWWSWRPSWPPGSWLHRSGDRAHSSVAEADPALGPQPLVELVELATARSHASPWSWSPSSSAGSAPAPRPQPRRSSGRCRPRRSRPLLEPADDHAAARSRRSHFAQDRLKPTRIGQRLECSSGHKK